jgi:hypothetical protein
MDDSGALVFATAHAGLIEVALSQDPLRAIEERLDLGSTTPADTWFDIGDLLGAAEAVVGLHEREISAFSAVLHPRVRYPNFFANRSKLLVASLP